MKNYYTEKQYKELLKDICILHQTNEKVNDHIINFFDQKGISHSAKSLNCGDYCFKLLKNESVGRFREEYFTDELFIERKNSLGELASSICNESFHYELKRCQNIKHKYLIVEQEGGWQDILKHNYQNDYNEKSFYKTLHTFMTKYGLKIIFTTKEDIARQIYHICIATLNQYIEK